MPKVSQEYSEARRRQIIDAAYRCFAHKGFHQTTMRDIYDEASLSPGAVYHYFDSKDEIIRASFDFDLHRSRDVFTAAQASDDALRALDDLIDFFFYGVREAAGLGAGRVNVQGWGEALVNPQVGETVRAVMASYVEALTMVVRNAQAAGQIDTSLDPVAVSRLLLSVYYGLELQLALTPDIEVDPYATVVKVLLRCMSPTGPI